MDYEVDPNNPQRFVTRGELVDLENKISQVATTVENLASSTESLVAVTKEQQTTLVAAITGRVPEGSIPITTHKQVVKGLLWAFTVVVVVAVGAVKLVPALVNHI